MNSLRSLMLLFVTCYHLSIAFTLNFKLLFPVGSEGQPVLVADK